MSQATEVSIPSYEKINYRIRPAKSIERKMLCESFRKLNYFSPVNTYRYIGFGSPFFADFNLFHKQLGIEKMISIEKDSQNQARFDFNKPYRCIEMLYGLSTDELPQLVTEDSRDIIWLDYDGHLDKNILNDINTVFYNISSGSIVTITVNVNYRNGDGGLALFRKLLDDKAPENVTQKDLALWNAANVCRDIIIKEITKTIKQRNRLLEEGERFNFEQLYYFGYSDGAKMLTIGGIVYNNNEIDISNNCRFTELPFIRTTNDMYLIDVPSLTYKEIRFLDSLLPSEDIKSLVAGGIKSEDIERYSKLYKYFPTFSETEI